MFQEPKNFKEKTPYEALKVCIKYLTSKFTKL